MKEFYKIEVIGIHGGWSALKTKYNTLQEAKEASKKYKQSRILFCEWITENTLKETTLYQEVTKND